MPTVLPLQIRKAPTIYEVATFHGDTTPFRTGNISHLRQAPSELRIGTFYTGVGSGPFVENCGATGFEFVKPTSGAPTYRYYPSMNRYSWREDFLYGSPTYTDSSNPRYSFWQSVSPNLYSFLNSYHSGGLPINKLIKVWVSWDKFVLSRIPGSPTTGRRSVTSYGNSIGVCCRYAIFS
jgi:hypothetical protein